MVHRRTRFKSEEFPVRRASNLAFSQTHANAIFHVDNFVDKMPIRTQYRPQVLPTFNLKRSPLPGTRSAAASQIATKTRARFIHKLVQTYRFCHAYFPQARAQQLLIAQVSCPAETPCAIIHLEERRRFDVNPLWKTRWAGFAEFLRTWREPVSRLTRPGQKSPAANSESTIWRAGRDAKTGRPAFLSPILSTG